MSPFERFWMGMIEAAETQTREAIEVYERNPGNLLCHRANPCEVTFSWEGGPLAKVDWYFWSDLYDSVLWDAMPWPLVAVGTMKEPSGALVMIVGRADMEWGWPRK